MEEPKGLKMDFKDIVVTVSLVLSIVTAYFTVIRDHESRIVRLETKVEQIGSVLEDIKRDQKEIKSDIRAISGVLTGTKK